MPSLKSARYDRRNIREWLEMANKGEIALPIFQRSYVWDNQRTADYLMALFENRPTGIFLILETDNKPQFDSRTLKGIEADTKNTQELVLDGQQRLTSLWNALRGTADHKFYVKVKSLTERDMEVEDIISHSERSPGGRALRDARAAFNKNLVPLDILWDDGENDDINKDEPGKIGDWCESVYGDYGDARRLESAIRRLQEQPLLARNLQYCALPAETSPAVAIDIFIETNKSSVTIKRFDILVAYAQKEYEEHLRQHIEDFHRESSVTPHYFRGDEQETVPEIGEWLLKVACLKSDMPPREKNYESALSSLLSNDPGKEINRLLQDLEEALKTAAQHGGATQRTLASWPPVHVIAALQSDLRAIDKSTRNKAARKGTASKLISAYLWRAFLTDRYEAQANDRLFEDYKKLRECLERIRNRGKWDELPVIFDNDKHPLPTAKDLEDGVPWIALKARLGRAVAAVAMQQTPRDWIKGKKLDSECIRNLENDQKLERHHVFPRDFLKDQVDSTKINHGLNGVLLTEDTNRAFSKKDPALYLKNILERRQGLDKAELRTIVESHLVPYDALVSKGTRKNRYRNFIKKRAELVAKRIEELADLKATH